MWQRIVCVDGGNELDCASQRTLSERRVAIDEIWGGYQVTDRVVECESEFRLGP